VYLRDIFDNETSSDDVTTGEAAAGDTETWTLYLRNTGTERAEAVRVWMDSAVPDLEISPDGVTYSAPTQWADAITLAAIGVGEQLPVYFRRTIAPATPYDPDVLNLLHTTFSGAI